MLGCSKAVESHLSFTLLVTAESVALQNLPSLIQECSGLPLAPRPHLHSTRCLWVSGL